MRTVTYLQPLPQSDSQSWGIPAPRRICRWLAPDPSSSGLEEYRCWKLPEGVRTDLAQGVREVRDLEAILGLQGPGH